MYASADSEAFDPQWTARAYELQVEGRLSAALDVYQDVMTELVSGPCPRCDDPFDFVHTRSAVLDGTGPLGGRSGLTTNYVDVEMACACVQAHPQQPAEHQGCGAHYTVLAQVVPR